MRKIKVKTWKINTPELDEDGNPIIEEGKPKMKEHTESLLVALNVLLVNTDPKNIPRGIDEFRFKQRLAKAFDKAEKTKILELEEMDYSQLKKIVEKDVPSNWGMNPDLSEAIDLFMESKQE